MGSGAGVFHEGAEPRRAGSRRLVFFGRASYDANRFERSIEAFEQALRLDPEQGRIYENLGLAQDALGKFGAAEKSLRKAVELARGTYRPYLAYGAFLFRQGRAAEGLPLLRQALAIAPGAVDVRFELARMLYQQDARPKPRRSSSRRCLPTSAVSTT